MQRLIHKLRLLILFLVFSATGVQILFPGNAIASGEFEIVMLGETKVLLRESDEYCDEASVFAIMLAGNGHQKEDETHCAHVAEHIHIISSIPASIKRRRIVSEFSRCLLLKSNQPGYWST